MNQRQEKAERTKQKLRLAAFRVIRESGVRELSANKIAAAAGISKGALFHHFAQIEDLYLELLDFMVARFEADVSPAEFPDFPAYVKAATRYLLAFLDESPEVMNALFYFVSQSEHNAAYHKRLRAMTEASLADWGNKISYFFDPPLEAETREFLVRTLDIYFAGFSLQYLVFKDREAYERMAEEFTSMIVAHVERRRQ